jgi:hypothetical protein
MLAVQMIATHFVPTRALRCLKGSDTVSRQDSNGNLAVKLLRTFTAQTEALQRYRGKGQQKVTVEHVHEDNPMHLKTREPSRLRQAPRCPARTRRGMPYQSPAVAGKTRCRMHGRAAGSGAPTGKRNGKYRHGGFTTEAIDERRRLASSIRDSREFLSRLR